MIIMMKGHDGKEGGWVGGEKKNVLFLKCSFALKKLQKCFVGQAQDLSD